MKNYTLVLLFAILFAVASTPVWGIKVDPLPFQSQIEQEQQKTCLTIGEQITDAEAVEDYAENRYDLYKNRNDYWTCYYAAKAYEGACQARGYLERLNGYLCVSPDTYLPAIPICHSTTCSQSH